MKERIKSFLMAMALTVIVAIVCTACGTQGASTQDKEADKQLHVVATTTMLADLAKEVGKDHVMVTGLMKPDVDSHLYQATAGDVETMKNADVVVLNGVHLEGKMGEIFEHLQKEKKALVRISDAIPENTLLDFEEVGSTVKDPHIWFSIANWKLATDEVVKGLAAKDPAHKADYEANAKAYKEKLDALDKENLEKIAQISEGARVLVTAHDAFSYFARDNKFEVKGIQGVSTDSEAATSDISELAKFIAERKIKAIFVESSVPHKTIEALQAAVKAEGFDVTIGGELYSDSLGDVGTPEGTYIGMYQKNVDTIVSALK